MELYIKLILIIFPKKKNDFKVRVISSNISIDRFYSNKDNISVIKDLINISEPDLDEKIIFVWPEGILPDIKQKEFSRFSNLFEKSFNEKHLIIAGVNSHETLAEFNRVFNSFSVYDHKLNLVDSYNKIRLVPFGEFLPLEKILKNIGFKTITNNYQSFSKGDRRNIIKIKNENFSLKILPLICYEIIYSGDMSDNFDFDFIVNISEDGWFGKSIGPEQHFVHSIFRAIESGKYIFRSANNGIAAIINPLGQTEKKLSLGETGYLDLQNYKNVNPTIFSKYGNRVFFIISFIYILAILILRKVK